jgi:hypothetical protein
MFYVRKSKKRNKEKKEKEQKTASTTHSSIGEWTCRYCRDWSAVHLNFWLDARNVAVSLVSYQRECK